METDAVAGLAQARAALAAKGMAASATGTAGEARSAEPAAAPESPLFPSLLPAPEPTLSAALVRAASSGNPNTSAAYAACAARDGAAAAGALDSRAKRRRLCAQHGIQATRAHDTLAGGLAHARETLAARVMGSTSSLHKYWQPAASHPLASAAPGPAEPGGAC